jgi:DNA-binding transcriptional LysR family regulator
MNLEFLRSYLAVIRTGSFHGAARELGLAQPTVSQHVKKLEEALGATLVVRSSARCLPIARTETFIRRAEALLRFAEFTRASLDRPAIVIGASSNIGIYLLQPYFKTFRSTFDEFAPKPDLVIASNEEILGRLERDEIDFGVTEWWNDRPGFVSRIWRREKLVVITEPHHPWAALREIDPGLLSDEPMIGGEPGTGTGRILRDKLGPLAQTLRVTLSLGSTEAVKEAVRHGLGVSIVFESSVQDEVRNGSLASVRLKNVDVAKDLHVAHRSDLRTDSPAMRFLDLLAPAGSHTLDVLEK